MARLVELFFFAIVIYMVYRRLFVLPFRRGYHEREKERQEGRFARWKAPKQQIDRSNAKDAEFKDIT